MYTLGSDCLVVEVVECSSQDQKYGGFKSPMTHRNFCNHNLIKQVAQGIHDNDSSYKNLHFLQFESYRPKTLQIIIKRLMSFRFIRFYLTSSYLIWHLSDRQLDIYYRILHRSIFCCHAVEILTPKREQLSLKTTVAYCTESTFCATASNSYLHCYRKNGIEMIALI